MGIECVRVTWHRNITARKKKLVMIQYTKENTHRICSFILKATRRHEQTASQPERGTRTSSGLHNVLGGKVGI